MATRAQVMGGENWGFVIGGKVKPGWQGWEGGLSLGGWG